MKLKIEIDIFTFIKIRKRILFWKKSRLTLLHRYENMLLIIKFFYVKYLFFIKIFNFNIFN